MGEQVTLQERFNQEIYLNTSFFIRGVLYIHYNGKTMEDVSTV